ncbi:MAG: S41 family peptidase [Gemmataceae bacterium]|nr:S41 family peptidase [Gemmataceae bacterium]
MKSSCSLLGLILFCGAAAAREPIRLPNNPALSPDGKLLAFDWNGDIWVAASAGGEARQLTAHSGKDAQPKFSPDGKEIAFVSDREGGAQVFVVPVQGGVPRQVTFHTAGHALQEFTPDGNLLVKATRDHFWRHGERFFTVAREGRGPQTLLFDDYGSDGTLSPDGSKLLFTREGEQWWRKGYTGSRVTQVWLHDRKANKFSKVLHQVHGCRWPLWKPDGSGFWFVGEHGKGSNLCEYDFQSKYTKPLTTFKADSVVFPCAARDGSLIVFRHLFDLYAHAPGSSLVKKLDLWHNADRAVKTKDQRLLDKAKAAAFASDGLEIAFIAGGDLWVMDTELREPRQITKTADEESSPVFTQDNRAILFVAAHGDKHAIWKATRQDAKQYWWQNRNFTLTKLAESQDVPSRLTLSPDGKKLAYVRGRGDLWIADSDGKKHAVLFTGWNAPDFDWSPDGKWLVYSVYDNDFNRDVFIRAADDSGTPYNVSRHPFTDGNVAWSPDGKMIAFSGRRSSGDTGANISIVYLRTEDDEKTPYDRKLEKALEKMKGRTSPAKSPAGGAGKGDAKGEAKGDAKGATKPAEKKKADVVIDFDELHERVKRVNLGTGSATAVFWSPDSKKLAFTGVHDNKTGTFTIEIGDKLTPKELSSTTGKDPVWLSRGNQIVWLVGGVPTSTPATGGAAPASPTPAGPTIPKKKGAPVLPRFLGGAGTTPGGGGSYTFSVRQDIDVPGKHAAVFDACWRIMRDNWYDAKLGNNDWNAVRAKYRPVAAQAPDLSGVAVCVQMMLGELNGSHLGFSLGLIEPGAGAPERKAPRDVTRHLGVRFDHAFAGPGLKIRDVLPSGPADKKRSRLHAGEVILRIDGKDVSRDVDLTTVLNGPADRDVSLSVKGGDGQTRTVALKPITYPVAQGLLYQHWLRHNRKLVAEASQGKLGYLHISAMSMPTFRKFEEELVSEGVGKDGLIIDVRENPGGSTADHLLTALTQPVHAIAVPRGGGPGYPQDRKVYQTWNKPIVVLCNQNSGSNAEIFSHAVKTLGRGQLVGISTAGAVVSTGAVGVMDVGILRLPFRGWFTIGDGEDMEKHGAVPHHVLWPEPCALPQGRDAQLAKAIEVLRADVQAWGKRPQPKLRLSTER